MSAQIIEQPNGLVVVFSSSADTFVVTDATAAEILAYFVDLATLDTTRCVHQLLDHVTSGQPRGGRPPARSHLK